MTRLRELARDKYSGLLGPFISFEENNCCKNGPNLVLCFPNDSNVLPTRCCHLGPGYTTGSLESWATKAESLGASSSTSPASEDSCRSLTMISMLASFKF